MIPTKSFKHSEVNSGNGKSLAVLGGKGAYSYLAAKKYFSNSNNTYLPCGSFEAVLQSVEQGKVDYGVIPIENTTSGGITEVYDLLLESSLSIIGEEKYNIRHCLVGLKGNKLKNITSIMAHPQASRQCSQNLKKLASATIHLVQSTAHALDFIVSNRQRNTAAIACEESANLFGLEVLKRDLANQVENITRFLVLAQESIHVPLSVPCKTSIALSTGQKAGSLAEILSNFHEANIPLSRLESRPIPNKPWEQMFHLDLQGNISDQNVETTLSLLSKQCRFLKVLGSYPTEDIPITHVSEYC